MSGDPPQFYGHHVRIDEDQKVTLQKTGIWGSGIPGDEVMMGAQNAVFPGDDPGTRRSSKEHALARILEITLRPSSKHPKGSHAYSHFMADFDEIRAICREHLNGQ